MDLALLLAQSLPATTSAPAPLAPAELPWPAIIARWIHIASAAIAIGGPFFNRYFLMPAVAKTLDPEPAEKLRARITSRWKYMVHLLITLFILTGLYTFLFVRIPVIRTWPRADQLTYHALFGVKMVLAFALFILASALSGRASVFAAIRRKPYFYTSLFLLLAFTLLFTSSILRYLPMTH